MLYSLRHISISICTSFSVYKIPRLRSSLRNFPLKLSAYPLRRNSMGS